MQAGPGSQPERNDLALRLLSAGGEDHLYLLSEIILGKNDKRVLKLKKRGGINSKQDREN